MRVPINTHPMGNGPAGPVDCEHETSIDLIVSAPTTHPVTQVGHDIVLGMYKKRMLTHISLCQIIALKVTLFFFSARLN